MRQFDIAVVCGHREREEQERCCREGTSRLHWPHSRHNSSPSLAVDIAPWRPGTGIDWDDVDRFRLMAGYVLGAAAGLGIPLRWGGDWDRDFDERDERFRDMPHFELVS